jgi:hypothetical protein
MAMAGTMDWRTRLGGRWLVSWQAYAIGTPIAFITLTWFGIDQAPPGTARSALTAWAGLVAVACAVVGALMLLAHATVLRHRVARPIPALAALAYLAVLGATFALVLIVGTPIVGAPALQAPGFTVVAMAVISAWWGSVLVLTLDARERITSERIVVLNAAVDQEVTNVQQADLSRILRDFLDTRVNAEFQSVRDTLDAELIRVESDARTGGWTRVSDELRLTARASVRQLSADLWGMAETTYPKVTAWSMIPAIIRTQPLRPWAVALLVLLVTVQATTDRLGMPWGPIAAVAGAMGVYAVLALANVLMRARPRWHAAIFVGTMVLITAGGAISTAASGGEVSLPSLVFNFAITAILLIATAAFGAVYRANSQMITSLATRVDREAIENMARQRELATIARQAASILHGQVQTRLVACASAVDRALATDDYPALARALEQARDILEQPLRLPDTPTSLDDVLAAHRDQWRGVVDVDFDPSPVLNLSPEDRQRVSLVVEEGIVNAFRHGDARRVHISIDAHGADTLILVEDDGCGPQRPWTAGTGSAVLTHIAGQRWQLTDRGESRGGRLEVTLAT